MTENNVDEGDYLVTKDLPLVLQDRYGLELSESQDGAITNEERRMTERWQDFVPGDLNYRVEDARYIRDQVNAEILDSETPVVSLSRVYGPEADYFLEVTRITDPAGEGETWTGSRDPGSPLEQQIEGIGEEVSNIRLADSGIFTGETLNEVADRFRCRDVEIDGAILGVAPYDYPSLLDFEAAPVQEANIGIGDDGAPIGEWIEARDLAVGIEGRKTKDGGIIPYNENMDWLTIPEETADKASRKMEEYSDRILNILDIEDNEGVFGERVKTN